MFKNLENEKYIDIFQACIQGTRDCVYDIDGAPAQLKPCRVFAEACCQGELDTDWENILKGVCFGFRVIDSVCESKYFKENYSSITQGARDVKKVASGDRLWYANRGK